MNLADALRGVSIRRPILSGTKRRVFYAEDPAQTKKELRRQRKQAYQHKYYLEHKEEFRAKGKGWREKNKVKDSERKREWRLKNLGHYNAYNAKRMREWSRENREEKNAKAKLYREQNREILRERQKAYVAANREAVNARRREKYARSKA